MLFFSSCSRDPIPWPFNSSLQLSNNSTPLLQPSSSILVSQLFSHSMCPVILFVSSFRVIYCILIRMRFDMEIMNCITVIIQLALLLRLCQTLTSSMLAPLELIPTLLLGWQQQPRLQVSIEHIFRWTFIFMIRWVWCACNIQTFLRSHSGSTTVLWCSLGCVSGQSFPATGCINCQSLS